MFSNWEMAYIQRKINLGLRLGSIYKEDVQKGNKIFQERDRF